MEQKSIFMALILVMTINAGCQQQTEIDFYSKTERPQRIITAIAEGGNGTRTMLSNPENGVYYPCWKDNDEIGVFSNGTRYAEKYTLRAGSGTDVATFIGPDLVGRLVGVYPFSSISEEGLSEEVLSLRLPSVQQYAENSFGDGSYPMVAVSDSSKFVFKNLCSVLHLSLLGSDTVESVRFIAHDPQLSVSGKATIRTDFDAVPELIMKVGGSPDVALLCGGVELNPEKPTSFFLVLPPGTYKGGFEVEIISKSGKMIRSTQNDVTFDRSQYRTVPTFTFVPEAEQIAIPEPVDLGLPSGLKWASFNLGASKPEEYGDYYAWGETEPYYISQNPLIWKPGKEDGYSWTSYKWCMGSETTLTKYCADAGYGYNGFVDNKTVLDPEDDAAFVNLGGDWRMPTKAEEDELINYCTWEWTSVNGVEGRKGTGPNGNSIFLPAAGSRWATQLNDVGDFGFHWPSTSYAFTPKNTWFFNFNSSYVDCGHIVDRAYGFSIRPVYDDRPAITIETLEPTNIGPCSAEIPFTISTQDTVYEYGVIYSTNRSEPVIGNLGDGQYNAVITSEVGSSRIINELKPNTTYYARAFVILGEEHGTTVYGNTIQFTTKEVSYSSDYVDIGLSVAWATCNLGSSTPSNVGGYYRWGETDLSCSSTGYIWSGPDGFTKYNANDGKVTLEASDDAASVNLGGKWRMPTNDELTELRNNCTWSQATLNGVKGCTVTGPNGKSIFIPISEGTSGEFSAEFLSSSLSTYSSDAYRYVHALSYDYDNNSVFFLRTFRNWGTPIRPVYDNKSATTIITNTPTNIGPCSAEIPFDISSTESIYGIGIIYSTDKNDPVVGDLGNGKYSMYITSDIGSSQIINELKPNTTYFARAFITIGNENGQKLYGNTIQFTTKNLSYSTQYVDIGLSVKWASCNLGSSTPSDVGGYYGWGETVPSSLRTGYKWSGSDGYTKYNANDEKVTLDASDDAAYVNLGDGWRMPTNEEIAELRDNCTWTQATRNGVLGCLVTGPNGKSVFIPISEGHTGSFKADILTSSLTTEREGYQYVRALSYSYYGNRVSFLNTFRTKGTPIRPVYDGSKTQPETEIPKPIDLGLPSGVKWASFNLGASNPEEYGDYYAWGETEPYYISRDPLTWKEGKESGYIWASYRWCRGSVTKITKYCSDSSLGADGFTDGKTVLDLEDDAAHVNLGGSWRMPTYSDWTELQGKCTWKWTSINGVNGREVIGPNGNSIFLPATGLWNETSLQDVGSRTDYLSSSLRDGSSNLAWFLAFNSDTYYMTYGSRCLGLPIRPVQE